MLGSIFKSTLLPGWAEDLNTGESRPAPRSAHLQHARYQHASLQYASHRHANLQHALRAARNQPALHSFKIGFISLQPVCPELVSLSACPDPAFLEPQEPSMEQMRNHPDT